MKLVMPGIDHRIDNLLFHFTFQFTGSPALYDQITAKYLTLKFRDFLISPLQCAPSICPNDHTIILCSKKEAGDTLDLGNSFYTYPIIRRGPHKNMSGKVNCLK
jgi:hypothetical protein